MIYLRYKKTNDSTHTLKPLPNLNKGPAIVTQAIRNQLIYNNQKCSSCLSKTGIINKETSCYNTKWYDCELKVIEAIETYLPEGEKFKAQYIPLWFPNTKPQAYKLNSNNFRDLETANRYHSTLGICPSSLPKILKDIGLKKADTKELAAKLCKIVLQTSHKIWQKRCKKHAKVNNLDKAHKLAKKKFKQLQ